MTMLSGTPRFFPRTGGSFPGTGFRRTMAQGLVICGLVPCAVAARAGEDDGMMQPESCADSRAAKDPEAARVAFRAGQTAFSEGAYARAVALWDQAYRDDCTAHALLLNLAMAQELLGRPEDAIHTLQLFNRRSPESPYVEANAKRIQQLERAVADNRERARQERVPGTPVDRPAAEPSGVPVPIVVSIAGGVLAVAGGALYLEGSSSAASAEDRCGVSRQQCESVDGVVDGERARSRAQVGGWMGAAGLVVAAGGIVWHIMSEPERPLDQRATASGPFLSIDGPSRAGVGWSGQF